MYDIVITKVKWRDNMLINGTSSIQGVYKNYKVKSKENAYETKANLDVANISQTGNDFAFTMEKLRNSEDVRTEKVESIKKQIENETYKVDSNNIARAMLLGEINF